MVQDCLLMIWTTDMKDICYLKSFSTSIVLSLVKAGFGRLLTSSDAERYWLTASSLPIATQAPLAPSNVDKVLSMGYSDVLTTTLYGTANYRIVSHGRSFIQDEMKHEPEYLPKRSQLGASSLLVTVTDVPTINFPSLGLTQIQWRRFPTPVWH